MLSTRSNIWIDSPGMFLHIIIYSVLSDIHKAVAKDLKHVWLFVRSKSVSNVVVWRCIGVRISRTRGNRECNGSWERASQDMAISPTRRFRHPTTISRFPATFTMPLGKTHIAIGHWACCRTQGRFCFFVTLYVIFMFSSSFGTVISLPMAACIYSGSSSFSFVFLLCAYAFCRRPAISFCASDERARRCHGRRFYRWSRCR